ncbi:MAG: mandelate racemase [Gemmatales bacterium]|nr:MAG: mandelate racemase [Gemmatales bacterium]
MRITQVETQLLRIPLERPIAGDREDRYGKGDHVFMLAVHLDTDAGHRGLGFAYALQGGGRALKALADDDLAPLVVGEDPLDHERLGEKVYWGLQGIGRRGLVAHAYSAVDLALWDIKGKVAGLPLYKLLGGAREASPVYGSDTGWLWMSTDEIIDSAQRYLDQKMIGIKIKVGGDPQADADRLTKLRDALGDDVWLGVDANQRYDYTTALAIGHYFEEELSLDWFEEPISCEDVDGHASLADKLEIPIALGETLFGIDEFERYFERRAVGILQPDVTRVGGVTQFLKIAALAERHHCPIAPHLLPEVSVHLACGLTNVKVVEYMPWLYPAFVETPAIVDGKMVPPKRPGLGLEINPEAVEKYQVAV